MNFQFSPRARPQTLHSDRCSCLSQPIFKCKISTSCLYKIQNNKDFMAGTILQHTTTQRAPETLHLCTSSSTQNRRQELDNEQNSTCAIYVLSKICHLKSRLYILKYPATTTSNNLVKLQSSLTLHLPCKEPETGRCLQESSSHKRNPSQPPAQCGCLPLTDSVTQRLSSSLEVTSKKSPWQPRSKIWISKLGSQYAAKHSIKFKIRVLQEEVYLGPWPSQGHYSSALFQAQLSSYSLTQPINFLLQ